jgi:hypothetical protein
MFLFDQEQSYDLEELRNIPRGIGLFLCGSIALQ